MQDQQETAEARAAVGSRLGDLLLANDLVAPTQLAEALLQQTVSGKRLGQLLVELGAIDERDLVLVLSEQLGVPIADLSKEAPQQEALERLAEPVARTHNAVPLTLEGNVLRVAVRDPDDVAIRSELRAATSCEIELLIAPSTDIQRVINKSYRALSGVERQVRMFEAIDVRRAEEHAAMQKAVTDEAPVVQIVNMLITQGLRDRASDIHIEPQDDRVRIRYRIDGALHDATSLPNAMSQAVVSRIKVLAGMNIVERQRPQDGQIAMIVDGRSIDIRVATTATLWGEKAVLRILDKSRSLFRLSDLGMPPDTNDRFSRIIRSPFGMVLCAGPTGSGKTTTLYASLQEINDAEKNIMTIEDPVEYVFPSVNQIQIKEQAGMTFAGGLKSILRQDPDVILVGEIRDVETARIAVQSALTGHFVFSTLHATDAASAVFRFLDMGIESFLISSSVLAVVGQRLVRRICTSCKVEYQPSSEEQQFYAASGGSAKERFYRGEGCNFCAQTGYQDRIGIYEMLEFTEQMRELVARNAPHGEIRALATQQGMRTLRQEAISLVEHDMTTIPEVLRAIYVL